MKHALFPLHPRGSGYVMGQEEEEETPQQEEEAAVEPDKTQDDWGHVHFVWIVIGVTCKSHEMWSSKRNNVWTVVVLCDFFERHIERFDKQLIR